MPPKAEALPCRARAGSTKDLTINFPVKFMVEFTVKSMVKPIGSDTVIGPSNTVILDHLEHRGAPTPGLATALRASLACSSMPAAGFMVEFMVIFTVGFMTKVAVNFTVNPVVYSGTISHPSDRVT